MYPLLVDLGWWQLRSYGVFVAVALIVGAWWGAREAERRGFARAVVYEFAQWVALAGLVGARLYYVAVSEPAAYLANPWEIVAVWHGGLSVHGGLLGFPWGRGRSLDVLPGPIPEEQREDFQASWPGTGRDPEEPPRMTSGVLDR